MKPKVRYLLILLLILVLWNTIIMKPLKLFTVFLHELGHATMAMVFGGGINEFKIYLNESGYTITRSRGWFSSFMIANGGYVGSVLFALLILYLKRTAFKKYILGTTAIVFLTISIRFSGLSFTLVYSVIFAALVLVLYMLQNEKVTDWVIDIVGIAGVAYAVYDTFVDTIMLQLNRSFHLIPGWNRQVVTDAVQLAEMTGIPSIVWGILWLCIAIVAINSVLLRSGSSSGGSKSRKR